MMKLRFPHNGGKVKKSQKVCLVSLDGVMVVAELLTCSDIK